MSAYGGWVVEYKTGSGWQHVGSFDSKKRANEEARMWRAGGNKVRVTKELDFQRRQSNAAAKLLKVMNPSRPTAVRVRKLKGGGISIKPVKIRRSR